ncbi:MAG: hypothetical protein HDS39_06050 [Bacteroides sp.]|nr:hypothetical protein [Bacteroides sp.]
MENTFLKDIGKIINEVDLPTRSSKIMERIRRECIFLRNDYFRSFFTSDTVTIDPKSDCVKFKLDQHDLVEDYVKIYANSFGPFNPEKYFEKDTFRILWLLKEPYMQSGDVDKYKSGEYLYLGGHNQAEENNEWKIMENNPTLGNLIHITQTILQEITGNKHSEQEAMNHICILEVNHFPGLAFNGTKSSDDNIVKWCQDNNQFINLLVSFYNPNLVIGPRNILNSLCTTYEKSQEGKYEIYYNEDNKYKEFFNWARRHKLSDWPKAKHFIPYISTDMTILDDVKGYHPNNIIDTRSCQIILDKDEKENPEAAKEIKDEEKAQKKGKDWQWVSAAKTFFDENKNESMWWVAAYHPSYFFMNTKSVTKRLSDFICELLKDENKT